MAGNGLDLEDSLHVSYAIQNLIRLPETQEQNDLTIGSNDLQNHRAIS